MENFTVKLLSIAVNPWTVFFIFINILYKDTINNILMILSEKINHSNKFNLKLKNIELSLEQTELIKKELDESVSEKISKSIEKTDIYSLLTIFSDTEKIITDSSSASNLFLYKLFELNLVQKKDKNIFKFDNSKKITIWELTENGRRIIELYRNITYIA